MKSYLRFPAQFTGLAFALFLWLGEPADYGWAAPTAEPAKPAPVPKAAARPIPFHGTLAKVDKTAQTITLTGKTARQFYLTPQTKLTKEGRPATLADAVVGEEVGGSYREVDGKRVAVSIRFGSKPGTR